VASHLGFDFLFAFVFVRLSSPNVFYHGIALQHRYVCKLQQLRLTCTARHMRTMSLPKHLIAQIDNFLPPLHELHTLVENLDGFPCLLHGDINDDNVLGHFACSRRSSAASDAGSSVELDAVCFDSDSDESDGSSTCMACVGKEPTSWRPDCLLDFADSFYGDALFDLVALHVSVLRCDLPRLRAFLTQYCAARRTLPAAADTGRFAYRMMCLMLLHPVDGFHSATFHRQTAIASARTLHELQEVLWGITTVS
jgi:hypothetical protein